MKKKTIKFTRREFVQAASAAVAAPTVLTARRAESRELIVGEGTDVSLYQDIIRSIRKTMPSPGLVPTALTPTP